MRRYPFSFIALTTLGTLCAIPGALSLAGFGASIHPILEDPMAGRAFPAGDREAEGRRRALIQARRVQKRSPSAFSAICTEMTPETFSFWPAPLKKKVRGNSPAQLGSMA